jgi:uncharacterized protein (DUF58 family)
MRLAPRSLRRVVGSPVARLAGTVRGWFAASETGGQAADAPIMDPALLGQLDRLGLRPNHDLHSGLMGDHPAMRRTAGIEFADYRPYTRGDDLRRVDWNAYARLGTLHIRQAQAEHETVLYLLVDGSPSMEIGRPPKFWAARRLAAALGYIALSHLDRVRLAAPGATALTDLTLRGRPSTGALFRSLQELRPGRPAPFDDVLRAWGGEGGDGHIAVLISDLLLDSYQDGVRRLVGAGFGVVVLHLLSGEELDPPADNDLNLIDSETGEQRELHIGDAARALYRQRLQSWLAESETWCRSHGAIYCQVRSDWPVERVMVETLRKRGVLR